VKSRKIRHDSKTIPVPGHRDYGDGEDHGKWYRCWNCGFLCNIDREALGGPEDSPGVITQTFTTLDQYGNTTGHCEGTHGADQTACEASGGTWVTTLYEPVVESGCPLCGTLNWRGDY